MKIATAALALSSVAGCQKREEAQALKPPIVIDLPPKDGPALPAQLDLNGALARLSETTRRDLYCAEAMDVMARRPGISEEDVVRWVTAYGMLGRAAEEGLKASRPSDEDRVALFTLRERVPDDIRRGEPKYPIADCLVRADALKPTTR